MILKIIYFLKHPLPSYEKKASAGMDIIADLDTPCVLTPRKENWYQPTEVSAHLVTQVLNNFS